MLPKNHNTYEHLFSTTKHDSHAKNKDENPKCTATTKLSPKLDPNLLSMLTFLDVQKTKAKYQKLFVNIATSF